MHRDLLSPTNSPLEFDQTRSEYTLQEKTTFSGELTGDKVDKGHITTAKTFKTGVLIV